MADRREGVTDITVVSDGLALRAALCVPSGRAVGEARPGIVLCHGFPSSDPAQRDDRTYEVLAARIARDFGWTVLALNLRGCAGSEGQFSVNGWLSDIHAGVADLRSRGVGGVWLIGAGSGGSLAIVAGAANPEVGGVATLAARADFDDWGDNPERFLDHCRSVGVITDPAFPQDLSAWAEELKTCSPLQAAAQLAPRPLFLIHGASDDLVPEVDAERLAQAHGAAAVRIIDSADHKLRHDPRAIATLLGWLDRQRTIESGVSR